VAQEKVTAAAIWSARHSIFYFLFFYFSPRKGYKNDERFKRFFFLLSSEVKGLVRHGGSSLSGDEKLDLNAQLTSRWTEFKKGSRQSLHSETNTLQRHLSPPPPTLTSHPSGTFLIFKCCDLSAHEPRVGFHTSNLFVGI